MIPETTGRFTLEEYHSFGEMSCEALDERVELIRGEIIVTPPKTTQQSVCKTALWQELFRLIGDRAYLRIQEPIILIPDSEPQPDVVIARNRSDNYLSSHPYPEDILLVIEVADTTFSFARFKKFSLYAENKISNYWIFNLVDRCLEIYSEPYQDMQGKFSYRAKRIALPTEVVTLPCFPDISLELSRVFPMQSDA